MKKRTEDFVHLDHDTARWLAKLEAVTGTPIPKLVALILRDIRVDDEAAHRHVSESVH